jgi:hypothetical protein
MEFIPFDAWRCIFPPAASCYTVVNVACITIKANMMLFLFLDAELLQ